MNLLTHCFTGLLEGINKIPALKVLAISELSDSCSSALTKSSLFEGLFLNFSFFVKFPLIPLKENQTSYFIVKTKP